MADLTPEESKQKCINDMGQKLGSIYHALNDELAWLNIKWGEYVELFGTKPSRIELINNAAGVFFRIVQDTLWVDTLLHIARLTDAPKSVGKDNLTIRRLTEYINDEEFKNKIVELVNIAVKKAKFCKDWRNRHIAHIDLKLALKDNAKNLKSASRKKVKEVLKSISDVLNAISEHYSNSSTLFESIGIVSGAQSLLYVLDDGLKAKQDRQKRRKAGKYLPEDYTIRDL